MRNGIVSNGEPMYYIGCLQCDPNYLEHHGVLGMKWGVRRYQNSDETLTSSGKVRYGVESIREKVRSAYNARAAKQRETTKKALDFWGHDTEGRTKSAVATLVAGCIQQYGIKKMSDLVYDAAMRSALKTGRFRVLRAADIFGKTVLAVNAANIAVGVASNFTYKDNKKVKKEAN